MAGIDYGCPLWDANGDAIDLDGRCFGIYQLDTPTLELSLGKSVAPITIQQRCADEELNTARFVWNAGIYMCNFFVHALAEATHDVDEADVTAVELGAGTGICSAALARCLAPRVSVLATDLPMALPLISETVTWNSLADFVNTAPLDWCDDPEPRSLIGVDVVFGADITFMESLCPIVLEMVTFACRHGSLGVLAVEHREAKEVFERTLSDRCRSAEVTWIEAPSSLYLIAADGQSQDSWMGSIYVLYEPNTVTRKRALAKILQLIDLSDDA
eukprot:TRINITY_DN34279_c0_g1_i1.p1 TRINITY_DN34279_c0_g1~~TRINITY_DN34279_c0_g1_i1.p1  ORF type:complete len:273 (+),score=37.89 TRINITY_DN34279_c0_g1_i1:91-909(+)